MGLSSFAISAKGGHHMSREYIVRKSSPSTAKCSIETVYAHWESVDQRLLLPRLHSVASPLSPPFLCSLLLSPSSFLPLFFHSLSPDSIRTMSKYSEDLPETATLDAKLDYLFKECRGQRNFYITGFALFLIL